MKKWIVIPAVVVAAVVALIATMNTASIAKVDANTRLKMKLRKPDIVDIIFVKRKGTNWNYVMRNQGSFMYDSPDADENGNNAGGEFPQGSNVTIVFAAGAWLGTIKNGVPVVSETQFGTEFQPGPITNSNVPFEQLTAADPLLPEYKVYYIDEKSGDASSENNADWLAWPGDKTSSGDPYLYSSGGVGITWAVFNDLDTTLSQEGTTSSPYAGLGIQITLESIVLADRGDAGDGVFLKFIFDNKTNTNYPNSYLGLWMDADVDNSGNDLIGSDSSRGLGFVYNVDESDAHSAVGFDFFQGPVVSAASVSPFLAVKNAGHKKVKVIDENIGLVASRTLGGDSIWLGATTLNTYNNNGDPNNNTERYNLLRGLTNAGSVSPNSYGGWFFPGDPVSQTGPLDANPTDKRILHGVGPFEVVAGARQEVWAGVVGANVNRTNSTVDNLNAVAKMFATDDLIQTIFDADLAAPSAPDVPLMSLAGLDGKVVVTWKNNSEYSEDHFGDPNKAYIRTTNPETPYTADYRVMDFEGYRVYRSLTGLPGSFTQLAQYDDNNGITGIRELYFDANGTLSSREIILGTDNGLRYSYVDEEVTNLTTYYYSVTAYDAQPYIAIANVLINDPLMGNVPYPFAVVPRSLETSTGSNVTAVTPMAAVAGNDFNGSVSTLTHAGPSDGVVEIEVVNPGAVTGNNYRIEMFTTNDSADGKPLHGIAEGTLAYRVINTTTNQTVAFSNLVDNPDTYVDVDNNGVYNPDKTAPNDSDYVYDDRLFNTTIAQAGHPDQEEFGIVDGVMIKVTDASGWKSSSYEYGAYRTGLGKETRWWSGPGGLTEFGGVIEFTEEFWGIGGVEIPDRRDFDIVMSRDPSGWQVIYKHGTGSTAASNDTTLAPFSVFEVDETDGNTAPRQIEVNFRDRDTFDAWTMDGVNSYTSGGVGRFNYTYFDTNSYSGGTRALGFYTAPYDKVSYAVMWMGYRGDAVSSAPDADAATLHGLYVTARGAGSDGGTAITAAERHNIFSNWIDNGTFKFRVNHVLTPSDTYTYSTTAGKTATTSSAKKKGMDGILVVPNPYYGRSTYQASLFDKRVKFTGLPGTCTIRIFTVAGDLVRTLRHTAGSNNDRLNTNPLDITFDATAAQTSTEIWDLLNETGDGVASGMYIALVDAPGYGKKTVKFAVIMEKYTISGPDIR
ncbi:hypothetical protein L6Q79_13500 [bacterium]|nr:hypothetical protein [bacterium]NUN46142.1 hypothetical protein [bacterium]